MCGICGIFHVKAGMLAGESALRDMNDRIVHRGPDDAGSYMQGARRLPCAA